MAISSPRFNPFTGLLWVLFLAIAFYLLAWPPLEGVMARYRWKETPCYLPQPPTGHFHFEFNGTKYMSIRKNTWMVMQVRPFAATAGTASQTPNAVCYVRADSNGKAGMAVLNPHAWPTVEQLVSRLAILTMVVGAILLMSWRVRKAAAEQAAAGAARGSA